MLERELFAFLEGTSDAAFTVDPHGLICSWNRAAENLFGYTVSEVMQRSCAELFDGRGALGTLVCRDQCEVLECVEARREIPSYDLEVRNKAGDQVWLNVTIAVFSDDRKGRKLAVHLARDITERKRSELLTEKMLQAARQLVSLAGERVHPAPVSPLTGQERRVLTLLAKGKSPSEVARELRITPRTLRNHIHHTNHKLRTHNRLESVMHALRRGLI